LNRISGGVVVEGIYYSFENINKIVCVVSSVGSGEVMVW